VSKQIGKREPPVTFKSIIERARKAAAAKRPRVAVAGAHDESVLEVVCDAQAKGFASPVLFGDGARIREMAKRKRIQLVACQIVAVGSDRAAARQAAQAASSGEADILMKGVVTTKSLMKAALDPEIGIKTSRLMSHVAMVETDCYKRMLFMSDGGIVIEPTIEQKVEIIQNAVDVARALGLALPKVALVSSLETVNLQMKSAVDAAVISKMADRGQISGAVVDGPLAFDNAVSPEAARLKGVSGPVAGQADIIIVSHTDVGNVMFKALTYLCGDYIRTAGVIVGGRVPIVAVSRVDTYGARLNSIVVACLLASAR
jgi:phosphate butyryltransferase